MKTTYATVFGLYLVVAACTGALAAPAPVGPVRTQPAPLEPAPGRTIVAPPAPTPVELAPVPFVAKQAGPAPRALLRGFVDLHTHPLSNLGFGGKLLYGGVDAPPSGGSLLPSDPNCAHNVQATSVQQALGHDNSTHGAPGVQLDPTKPNYGVTNPCGDVLRAQFIHLFQSLNKANDPPDDSSGYPDFVSWPNWPDITHQKMWVEWIYRSYVGGLRVMVALAVNNKTTADSVAGPGDFFTDDKSSADLQLDEIKKFVGRHSDFMEIALSSADLYRIVSSNKLAVILGVEIDHIGNLGAQTTAVVTGIPGANIAYPSKPAPTQGDVTAEIGHLFDEGVRYIFPIHVIDNAFGGSAAYEDTFNLSNLRESGHYWALTCAPPNDGIGYRYMNENLFNPEALATRVALVSFAAAKLGLHFANPLAGAPVPSGCPEGMVNSQGLTNLGRFAIREMMRRGMLIDIDHMSERSLNDTIALSEQVLPGFYPLNSGHAGLRCLVPGPSCNERSLTAAQYAEIGKTHGMAGVGSAGVRAYQWMVMYNQIIQAMGPNGVAAFGTDTNGFAPGMPSSTAMGTTAVHDDAYLACVQQADATKQQCMTDGLPKPGCISAYTQAKSACRVTYPVPAPTFKCTANCDNPLPPVQYSSAFPMSSLGNKSWDYNVVGVAHYGMLPDFLQAVRSAPGGANMVDNNLMYGADYFYEMWRISELQSAKVGP